MEDVLLFVLAIFVTCYVMPALFLIGFLIIKYKGNPFDRDNAEVIFVPIYNLCSAMIIISISICEFFEKMKR